MQAFITKQGFFDSPPSGSSAPAEIIDAEGIPLALREGQHFWEMWKIYD
jgi:hypothetical protein